MTSSATSVNHLTKTSDAVGWTKYTYNIFNTLTDVTVGSGGGSGVKVAEYTYTDQAKLSTVTDALTKVTRYQYDTAGRAITVGAGSTGTIDTTVYQYHPTYGTLSKVTYGGTSSAYYEFDAGGRLTKLKDWIDGTNGLQYTYDNDGRLITLADYADYGGGSLIYAYDAAGRATSMTDYFGNATSYTYTSTGQVSTITAPGSKVWDINYNALGQRTSVSIPNGMTTAYGYDGRNRLTAIEHKDGAAVKQGFTYALDTGGNISRTTNADGSYWDYVYDGRNRLSTAALKSPAAVQVYKELYTYDDRDNLVTKQVQTTAGDDFSDGDLAGWAQVTSGGSWSNTDLAMTWSNANVSYYGFAGRVPSASADREMVYDYRMGDTSSASYHCWTVLRDNYPTEDKQLILDTHRDRIDLVERVDGVLTVVGTSSTFSTTQGAWYTVRAVCNGSSVTVYRGERGGTLSQIMNATTSLASGVKFWFGAMKDFQFDNVVFPDSVTTTTTTLAYNNGNELTSMTTGGVATNFAYDAWGRQTSKTQGGYSASYAYDYGGKLRSVTSNFPNEGTVTYQYGGDGKRRERVVAGGTTTRYKHDIGWNAINQTDGSNTLQMTTVYDEPLTQVAGTLADLAGTTPSSGAARYYVGDNLGTTRGLYAANKSALGTYDFTPYGSLYAQTGADISTLGASFTGKPWDSAALLYYFPARYYSPEQARWIGRDPLGMAAGANVYEYVMSCPITLADPLGLCPPTETECWDMHKKCMWNVFKGVLSSFGTLGIVLSGATVMTCLIFSGPWGAVACLIATAVAMGYDIASLGMAIAQYKRDGTICDNQLSACLKRSRD